MFADPRLYPPKPCAHCGETMACGDSSHDMSNWPRKRYCSVKCKRLAAREKERKKASARKASSRVEKPKKAPPIEIRESALDYTPEGASRSLREALVETFKLHPELGWILAHPNSTWGKLEFGDRPSKAI